MRKQVTLYYNGDVIYPEYIFRAGLNGICAGGLRRWFQIPPGQESIEVVISDKPHKESVRFVRGYDTQYVVVGELGDMEFLLSEVHLRLDELGIEIDKRYYVSVLI
jgi:hypothetical protein